MGSAHTTLIYTYNNILGNWGRGLGNTLPYFRISGSCITLYIATGKNALPTNLLLNTDVQHFLL